MIKPAQLVNLSKIAKEHFQGYPSCGFSGDGRSIGYIYRESSISIGYRSSIRFHENHTILLWAGTNV
jgi:hypothetical protein